MKKMKGYAYFSWKTTVLCVKISLCRENLETGCAKIQEGDVYLKKKWMLLLLAAALLGCGGCRGQEEEPVPFPKEEETDAKEEEIQEYPVEISGNLYDFQFAIDGEVKSLPSRIQEWIRQGWEYPEEKQKAMLETDSYIEGEVLKQGEKQLTVDLVNLEGKETQVMDCYVGGITLTYEKDGSVCQLPGGITLGKSSLIQVTEAYGTPTDEYSEKEELYVTYEFGTYKKAELVFDTEEEILQKAVLKNYKEPVSEEEEISRETPEEVTAYETPQKLTENPADYIVSYGREMYEIPAPVSEFVKNGWKIQEEGSDSYVKAGRHGYVTLEQEGTVLYAVVKNYSNQTVSAKHAFVTKISGDFDVVKVPITIGKGITLGMTEENMKLLLDGIPLETQKEEQGTSYYIYTDNTKKNFIRIFTDKDLGLIREIELSNSPEQLTAYTQQAPESIPESLPLGEGR